MKTKEQIQAEFQRAQQKWISICELAGKEYIDLQQKVQELNEEMRQLESQEKVKKEK